MDVQVAEREHGWGLREAVFIAWVVLGLAALYPVATYLEATFPVFTVVWLVVPLVAVFLSRDARRVGFRAVPLRTLAWVTGANLALLLLVMAIFEPWSDAYGTLVRQALANDPTFAWLVAFDGAAGWTLMFLFSTLVTIFAEELFFRGWLLQLIWRRTDRWWVAVLGQALLFTLVQALPAMLLSPVQAAVWIAAYAFLGVGVINGWAAARTESVWPGVIAAPLMNLIVTWFIL